MTRSARLTLVWLLTIAFMANVLSPRAALAAFAPDAGGLVFCHTSEAGAQQLPISSDAACRQHCMALAGALLTPQPPAIALALAYHAARPALPARQLQTVAPRHADAQPRAPPDAAV